LKLPYILLADDDSGRRDSFITVFEKHVPYAAILTVNDGQSFLSFLSGCGWKDLPSFIVLNYQLLHDTAPDLLRELLLDSRYLVIPKLIMMPTLTEKEIKECRMLGVKYFLRTAVDLFELEHNIRIIDNLLKTELNLV
jgi:CheY-like chemotaxis protein